MSEAAFFCERSGVRIVAPGVAKSAGGEVEEYGSAPPVHDILTQDDADRLYGRGFVEIPEPEPPLIKAVEPKRKTPRAPTAAPPIETPDPKPTE